MKTRSQDKVQVQPNSKLETKSKIPKKNTKTSDDIPNDKPEWLESKYPPKNTGRFKHKDDYADFNKC